MNKRTIQIDVIGPIEETELMMREKVFIRDGKSVDSAGVINTTNTFIEKD